MTDSSILTTQNAAPLLDVRIQPSSSSSAATVPLPTLVHTNGHTPHDAENAEEGAIKCICTNPDDDGNTVMCDKCETWQHIICYYANRDSLDDDDSIFAWTVCHEKSMPRLQMSDNGPRISLARECTTA